MSKARFVLLKARLGVNFKAFLMGPKSVSDLLVVALETVLPDKGACAAPSRQPGRVWQAG